MRGGLDHFVRDGIASRSGREGFLERIGRSVPTRVPVLRLVGHRGGVYGKRVREHMPWRAGMYLAAPARLIEGVIEAGLGPAGTPPGVRVGVDLVAAGDVAASVDRFGDRYLRRIFTEHELASCRGERVAEGLAARFAAKEATLKVLGVDDAQPGWRSIEMFRTPRGACEIRLRGEAARLADEAGIGPLAVSLSHDRGVAVAVVVALTGGEESRHG